MNAFSEKFASARSMLVRYRWSLQKYRIKVQIKLLFIKKKFIIYKLLNDIIYLLSIVKF